MKLTIDLDAHIVGDNETWDVCIGEYVRDIIKNEVVRATKDLLKVEEKRIKTAAQKAFKEAMDSLPVEEIAQKAVAKSQKAIK
jgi:hypothetical protein